MTPIRIRVLRHSAFYSPLLLSIAAGYLEQQGLVAQYDIATADRTVEGGLAAGEVQVAQSAVATSFACLARSEPSPVRHFAQINQRDGFFLTARQPVSGAFDWQSLVGTSVLVDHFFQPLAMFRYALDKLNIDFNSLTVIDAGDVDAIDAAFRQGRGDFVHQQGPYAQQLEADGFGTVVARVGDVIGPVAFSSLCASAEWLSTDMARAFMQAYRQGRAAAREMPAAQIARLEAGFFPSIDPAVLTRTIAAYQALGCWAGDETISDQAYQTLLDVFEFSGGLARRYAYDELISPAPA